MQFAASYSGQIALLGLSYKTNVDDMRESPAAEIVKKVAEKSKNTIWAVEPHLDELPKNLQGIEGLELVSIENAFRHADHLISLVDHSIFKGAAETYQKEIHQALQLRPKELVEV